MAQHSTMPFLVDAETSLLIRDHEEIAPVGRQPLPSRNARAEPISSSIR